MRLVWIWMIFNFIFGINSLKDVEVIIPMAVKLMDMVVLTCKFDLEGEELYTVKWYKGKREFYRFIPKEMPSMQIFPLTGIDVDLSKSTPNEVVLRNVLPEVTGKYTCEVSSDAPAFDTKSKSGYIYVVDSPVDDPELLVEKDFVDIGEILTANCTSPPSFPATNMSWYLNGEIIATSRVTKMELLEYEPVLKKRYVSFSELELDIKENMFQDGKLILRCLATLFDIYRGEKEVIIEETKPKPKPSSVLGPLDESSGCPKIVISLQSLLVLTILRIVFTR